MGTQPASLPVRARETEQDVEDESPERTEETATQHPRDEIQATINRANVSQVLDGEFAGPEEEQGEMVTSPQDGVQQPKHEPCTSKDLLQLERGSSSLENSLRVLQSKATSSRTRQEDTCKRGMPPLPESSVLGRVKSFLPVLDEANRTLFSDILERGAEQFDIEVVNGDDDKPYIQMDLDLGFADLYTPEAVAAAELAASGQLQQSEIPIGLAESSSESDSDEEKGTLENISSIRDFKTSLATVEMASNH